jgi:hypothetical protein
MGLHVKIRNEFLPVAFSVICVFIATQVLFHFEGEANSK